MPPWEKGINAERVNPPKKLRCSARHSHCDPTQNPLNNFIPRTAVLDLIILRCEVRPRCNATVVLLQAEVDQMTHGTHRRGWLRYSPTVNAQTGSGAMPAAYRWKETPSRAAVWALTAVAGLACAAVLMKQQERRRSSTRTSDSAGSVMRLMLKLRRARTF